MNQYEIRELTSEERESLTIGLSKSIFEENSQIFKLMKSLSEEEIKKWQELKSFLGNPITINLGVFQGDELVGWSWGYQESSLVFYMCNSAIVPQHRKKGLYTRLMEKMVEKVSALGFQEIYSRHSASNNAVIIPKLKAGFVITTMEVTDVFGVLVHLNYFPSKIRKKMMSYRVGEIKPDQEIKELLGI
jgi:hypothetical protein